MTTKRSRAESLLKADPDLDLNVVARLAGCSPGTAKLARRGVHRKPTKVARCEAVLRADPNIDPASVAEAVGCCYGTAYAAAVRLGINRDRSHGSAIGNQRRWHGSPPDAA